MLAYAAAACAGTVALISVWRGWRSISGWFFTAGMILLAVESVLQALATNALCPAKCPIGSIGDWR